MAESSNQSQNDSSQFSTPNAAQNIQGLADLLSNMLTTEEGGEKEVSVSWKTSNKPPVQKEPKPISSESVVEIDSPQNQHNEDIVVSARSNTGNVESAKITYNSSNLTTFNPSAATIPITPKPEPKFNAESKLLEAEIEDLRQILVNLEANIYDSSELINLLLPAVTETIRDTIQKREGAISHILKPGEGKTITEQIESETEVLMDALYPVVGSTIGEYIANTIRAVNNKVVGALDNADTGNNNLKVQMISPLELSEKESTFFKTEAVFLIHKKSHLIIAEKSSSINSFLTPELVASVLTNIRNLSHKFHRDNSNFLIMNYGENKINVYSGNYAYLAIIAKGNTPKRFLELLAQTIALIEKDYESCLKLFQGDRTIVPESLEKPLEELLKFEVNGEIKKRNKKLVTIGLITLFLIGIPTGIYQFFNYKNQQIAQEVLESLNAEPELSIYNLDVNVKSNKINLDGKLPSQYLKEKATTIASQSSPDLAVNNGIEVVNLPANQGEIKNEVDQILKAFNQIEGIDINADYQDGVLNLTGTALQLTDLRQITESFASIKGINEVNNQITVEPLQIPARIYFSRNSTNVAARDIEGKLIEIKDKMQKYPQLNLKIIGYKSPSERWGLGLQRAQSIENILEDLGIDRRRLEVVDGKGQPPDLNKNTQEQWLSQCVVFEVKSSTK